MITFTKQPLECFPLEQPREKQAKALDFVNKAIERDFEHIVIAAPTGIGKSAIGITLCHWLTTSTLEAAQRGGYYLVTQKLLQDQLEIDFAAPPFKCESIKSAVEYECPVRLNCAVGALRKPGCECRKLGSCPYVLQREQFMSSELSVTNYPYFFTERTYVKKFLQRQVLVADECHTLEKQIIRFIDLTISEETLHKWTPGIQNVPELRHLEEFVQWVETDYITDAKAKLDVLIQLSEGLDDKTAREVFELDSHINKIIQAVSIIKKSPDDWIYWQERDKEARLISIARPLNAGPFTDMLFNAAKIKIYMSAYPGSKEVFCRSLGLHPDQVAWAALGSTFKPQNRPIVMGLVGSMSMRRVDATMPHFLHVVEKIMAKHHDEKGIIHCNSYKLGKQIYEHFRNTDHGMRMIFPEKGDEREEKFKMHTESADPTIILSPSMTEGFDFHGNLARWQIIAKIPYPSLSDRQVCAKKDQDEEWYQLETVKTFIQACGRICRSDDDYGATYVLDSDFLNIWERSPHLFPRWFSDAFVWPKKKQ